MSEPRKLNYALGRVDKSLELHRRVAALWEAQRFLLDWEMERDPDLSDQAKADLTEAIRKLSAAASFIGDFEGRLFF